MHKFSTLLLIATLLGVAVADTIVTTTGTGLPALTYPIFLPRSDGKIYYGYGTTGGAFTTNAFLFDPATNTSAAATQTNAPTGRYANIYCTSPDKTKAFVGFGSAGTVSTRSLDYFILDLVTLNWTKQVNTTALPFKGRNLGPSIWLPSGQVLVFGGKDGNNFYNDLLSYDVATNNWTVVIPDKTAGSPAGRSGTTWTHNSDYTKWYIFGGLTASSPSFVVANDLIILDLKNLTWISQTTLTDIPARYTQTSALVQNTWFIIGGADAADKAFLNSFTIDLETETVSNSSRATFTTAVGSSYAYVKDDSQIILIGGAITAGTVAAYNIDPAVPLAPTATVTETLTTTSDSTSTTDTNTDSTTDTNTDSTTDTNTDSTTTTTTTTTDSNTNTNTGSSTSEDNGVSVIAPCVAVIAAAFAALF